MDLQDYFAVLRRRWMTLIIILLATIATAAGLTLAMTTKYTATTRLFFAVEGSESLTDMAQGSSFAEKQMTSYAEVATSPLVLEPVIERLAIDMSPADLAKVVTTSTPPDTIILEISVIDADPARAAGIANAIGNEVSDVAERLFPERADGTKTVEATTLSPALVPAERSSPNVARNLALGAIVGLLLGLGAALLQHRLDTRVRSEQDVRTVTDRPMLGMIGFDNKVPDHPLILRDEPLGAAAEAIRRLRTNFQFIDLGDRPRSIVITSSVPGEGKSTTSLNLAVALADAGSRVLLVDADLRRPSVANALGLEGQVGLTTVLIGKATVSDVVQRLTDTTLDVLPSGRIPPNPSELLGSRAMGRLLAELTETYDVVLLDTPPLLPVTDAAVLANLTGGALMVVGADRVHRPQLREALGSLVTAGAHLHGVLLNRIARQEAAYYTYESGYTPKVGDDRTIEIPVVPQEQPLVPHRAKRAWAESGSPSAAPPPLSRKVGGQPMPVTADSHARVNGSQPPPDHRATPVGR